MCVFLLAVMDCGKPACPSNGDVHFTETTFSSTCTFTCSVGHRMQGGSTSMCEEDGKWTGYPLCKGEIYLFICFTVNWEIFVVKIFSYGLLPYEN